MNAYQRFISCTRPNSKTKRKKKFTLPLLSGAKNVSILKWKILRKWQQLHSAIIYRFMSIAFFAGFCFPLDWFCLANFLWFIWNSMCIPHFIIEALENEEMKKIDHSRLYGEHCTLLLFVNEFTPQISSIFNSFVSGLDRIKFCNE